MDVYRQTTEYTGAISALMMVLHHFDKKVALNRETEFLFWQKSVNLPVRAPSIYALAIIAQEQGLSPSIVLEEKEYDYPDYRFKGYTKLEIDQAKYSSCIFAKQATAKGIPIQEREITSKEVFSLLEEGKFLLLRTNAGVFRHTGSASRYVVVFSDKKKIMVADPEHAVDQVTPEQLEESLSTLRSKKKRDVRMIVR